MDATNELDRLGLRDRTIERIFIGPNEEWVRFVTDENPVVWVTSGDCCSETWFSDLIGVHRLIGHGVLAATYVGAAIDTGHRSRQEVDSVQAIRLTTEAGDCDVIYRNSSNGYYGGSVYLLGPDNRVPFPPRLLGPEGWREVTENWRADELVSADAC